MEERICSAATCSMFDRCLDKDSMQKRQAEAKKTNNDCNCNCSCKKECK